MDKIYKILNWCFAVLLIIVSFCLFISSVTSGLILLFVALLITPLVSEKLKDMIKRPFGFWQKTAIVVVGMVLSTSVGINGMEKNNLVKADQLVEQAIIFLNKGEINEASNLINEAKLIYPNKKTNRATELEAKITQSKSIDYAFEKLISMTDDEYNSLLQGNLEKQYFEIKYLDDQFLALMKQESPNRVQYFAEQKRQEEERLAEQKRQEEQRLAEQKKQEEQQRIAAEQQRVAAEKEARKQKIESQFSSWDGAHYNLTKIIKASMNNPKSFEHVETVYWDMKDYLVVKESFRGTNAFGGIVTNTVMAKVSLDGEVFEIIE